MNFFISQNNAGVLRISKEENSSFQGNTFYTVKDAPKIIESDTDGNLAPLGKYSVLNYAIYILDIDDWIDSSLTVHNGTVYILYHVREPREILPISFQDDKKIKECYEFKYNTDVGYYQLYYIDYSSNPIIKEQVKSFKVKEIWSCQV